MKEATLFEGFQGFRPKIEMGARLKLLASFLVYMILVLLAATGEPVHDSDALFDFISKIDHSRVVNWNRRVPACGGGWIGVICNKDGSRVTGILLASMGLKGVIPGNTLARLSALQTLDLSSNSITGPFPADLLQLNNLTALYLEDNDFRGSLPRDFSRWQHLSVLNLSNNRFSGSIPPSVANMPALTDLYLANNSLSGYVPNFNNSNLQNLDLSNNNFTGPVPNSLHRFPSSSFLGNNVLLSPTKAPVPVAFPEYGPKQKQYHKLSKFSIAGITIGSCAVVAALITLGLILIRRKKTEDTPMSTVLEPSQKPPKKMASGVLNDCNSLTFFEENDLMFDLEDLLRASAEVLGKGSFGMTYRAVMEHSSTVVVKRLKDVIVGRRDFEQQMEVVGNIQHENVAPLRAYYYSKDEKLVIYDYYCHGCLSTLLHAKRGGHSRVSLNWETRLNLAIGAARGIAHIHSLNGGTLVHGNIKASNIFPNSQNHGLISDLGLATLMNPITSSALQAAGYKAPEVTDNRMVTQEGDVYSFGVVLLEILTGKSPAHLLGGGEEHLHLVTWVQAVVHEEWTGEVFDVELLRCSAIDEDLVAMLQVGLSCVARIPEQRPTIDSVMKLLEDIGGANAGVGSSFGTRSQCSSLNVAEGLL